MPEPIRVLICDDHPIVREALKSRLATIPEVEFIGEAGGGRELIERTRELKPGLVMVDVEMPELDGISATRRIIELWPQVKVLVFTAHSEPNVTALAAESGASGYLLKSAPADEMRRAVLTVGAGGTWFPRNLSAHDGDDELTRLRMLTARERQILDLLATGLRAEGVAREIGISPATVYTHVRNTVAKLKVDTRTQAVAIATRYAFISLDGQGRGSRPSGRGPALTPGRAESPGPPR